MSPRQLPSRYLYDALGSSLFEAICRLPWYRITTTEQRLLGMHSAAVFNRLGAIETLVELGPGSGEKLVTLLDGAGVRNINVHLVDVSPEALVAATRTIAARAHLPVVTHETTYDDGLERIADARPPAGHVLVLFFGSNIGNFDAAAAAALLSAIRHGLRRGDALLLGTDLVKPAAELILAYDDPLGVTAAFNKNLLVRMNRELGADFDVSHFAHRAVWNSDQSRVEMHLVSTAAQRVRIPEAGLDIAFGADEFVWTESSYKYRIEEIGPVLARAGFQVAGQWSDEGFALTLAEAV